MTNPVLEHRVAQKNFSRRIWILRPKITLKRYIWRYYLFRPAQVLSIKFEVQYWPRKWPENKFLNGFEFYAIDLTNMEIFSVLT